MTVFQYDTESDTPLDRALTRTTRRIVEDAVDEADTIRTLCTILGAHYHRTRSLLETFGLRDRFRKWQKSV